MVVFEPFRQTASVSVTALAIDRGERRLFEGLSFDARAGQLAEVRGPNGSGKTSLLRAIAGFLRPNAGRVEVRTSAEPSLAIHLVGHSSGLKGGETVRDHAFYWAGLFDGDRERTGLAIETVDLSRQAQLPARVLSEGQARRLALARLLIAPRPVWLLDEPAAGLDSQGKALLGRILSAHLSAGGVAIAALHEPLAVPANSSIRLA
jgi:heme exporter protein A